MILFQVITSLFMRMVVSPRFLLRRPLIVILVVSVWSGVLSVLFILLVFIVLLLPMMVLCWVFGLVSVGSFVA